MLAAKSAPNAYPDYLGCSTRNQGLGQGFGLSEFELSAPMGLWGALALVHIDVYYHVSCYFSERQLHPLYTTFTSMIIQTTDGSLVTCQALHLSSGRRLTPIRPVARNVTQLT